MNTFRCLQRSCLIRNHDVASDFLQMTKNLGTELERKSIRKVFDYQVRGYPGGNIGRGAGKGGGDGGSVRRSGGSLGEYGAAHEEEYFYRKQREQLEKIKDEMLRKPKIEPKPED